MKAKVIHTFTQRFGVDVQLDAELTVEKNGRYYLINKPLAGLLKPDYFAAGVYLGKAKEGKFFPSFNLLAMINKDGANRVVVDQKAAWLYICGRDILAKGVLKTYGATKKGSAMLVLNEYGECLGFGSVLGGFDQSNEGVAVRHVVDVGDFLRRER